MSIEYKDYLDFVPTEPKLKPKAKELVVGSVYKLLIQAAKPQKARGKKARTKEIEVTDLHMIQAMTYFRDYNINPIHGYTFYGFTPDGHLVIGAKMSCYYLVVSQSGLNAGNKKIKFIKNEVGEVVAAKATVYSTSPDGKGRIATTATVYMREFYKDVPSWKRPILRLGQLAYCYAVKQSPMNDGSLSGVYTEVEMEAIEAGDKPPKPKANPKEIKGISKTLKGGHAKVVKVKSRHKPIGQEVSNGKH